MSDIFMSYADEDKQRVSPLVSALNSTGWKVFWDRDILPGKDWRQALNAELENCRCAVVVWSKVSIESDWVQAEAEKARQRKILIPILIDDVTPPLGFGNIQSADFTQWDGTVVSPVFSELVKAVISIAGSSHNGDEKGKKPIPPVNLQTILPGTWQIEIINMYGQTYGATVSYDGFGNFNGQVFHPMFGAVNIQGRWTIFNNTLTAQGQQIVAFVPSPFFSSIQFSAIDHQVLKAINNIGEQLTFRRVG